MLNIRLTAQDIRTIRGATTPEEHSGVTALLLMRIEEGERLKKEGRTPRDIVPDKEKGVAARKEYGWREVRDDLKAILGDGMTVPPYPDAIWYRRVGTAIKQYGFTPDYVKKLGEYVKDNLKAPYQMGFIVTCHERILAGHFNGQKAGRQVKSTEMPNWLNDKLPD